MFGVGRRVVYGGDGELGGEGNIDEVDTLLPDFGRYSPTLLPVRHVCKGDGRRRGGDLIGGDTDVLTFEGDGRKESQGVCTRELK